MLALAEGRTNKGAVTPGRLGPERPPKGADGEKLEGEGTTHIGTWKQEAKPKPAVLTQLEQPKNITVKVRPPEHSREDIRKQDIVDIAAHADMPDVPYLCHILPERKVQAYLADKRNTLWECILANHKISELLNHTAWYHTRKSAAPDEARGGLSDYPIEGGKCADPKSKTLSSVAVVDGLVSPCTACAPT